MIPIGSELQPRSKADPVVTVCGIEGSSHILQPVDFASPFKLDSDELTAAYVCDEFKVSVEPFDEAALWFQFSAEKFDKGNKAGDRRAREQAAESSPEEIFRAAADLDA